jgi:predicted RND superfamily exporter protein
MTRRITVTIVDSRRWAWLRRAVAVFVVAVCPILIGVVLDSAAMQWMGFVLSVLMILVLAVVSPLKVTVEDAIAYLADVDKEASVDLQDTGRRS